MATPNPRYHTPVSSGYPNVAEVQDNDLKFNFMKMIDTRKDKMNKSLKETQEILCNR